MEKINVNRSAYGVCVFCFFVFFLYVRFRFLINKPLNYHFVFQDRLRREESPRRHQHNKMMDAKGNIRVFCRICDIIMSDQVPPAKVTLSVLHDDTLVVKELDGDKKNQPPNAHNP